MFKYRVRYVSIDMEKNAADALYQLLSLNYQLGIILQKRLDDFAIDTFLVVR